MDKMIIKNKSGSQMVEASVVIPIFILTVFSLISVCIFFFSSLKAQTSLHIELAEEICSSNAIFNIKTKTIETSKLTGGISKIVVKKKSEGTVYIINQAEIIRIGELLELSDDEE